MRFVALIISSLALAGCVPVGFWVKQGVTLAQYQRTQTSCEVTGAQQVPTNTQVGWAPYVGVYSADTNANLRNRVVSQCMTDKGYQFVEIPPCSNEISTAVRTGELQPRERMQVSPKTCWAAMSDGSRSLYTPEA